jgi:hypothetical protein
MKLTGILPLELPDHVLDQVGKPRPNKPNRIAHVGIELEGGWTKLPAGVRQLVHDGSIADLPDAIDIDGKPTPVRIGELPSPPMPLANVTPWLQAHYPQLYNESCGLHIHLSFNSALTYSRLMVPTYPATIIHYVAKWAETRKLPKIHPLWLRLQGQCAYCQHTFDADLQVTMPKDHNRTRPGHRYSVINYCYSLYNTLECRLLSMMDNAEQADDAVKQIIKITNAFLVVTAAREKKVLSVQAAEVGIKDEQRIYI